MTYKKVTTSFPGAVDAQVFTFPRQIENEDAREMLFDKLDFLQNLAKNSVSNDRPDYERELYYFVTLCHYDNIDPIHILDFCILNYSEIRNPGVLQNVKLLLEILRSA
jgi:hypothetical protein